MHGTLLLTAIAFLTRKWLSLCAQIRVQVNVTNFDLFLQEIEAA